VYAEKPFPPPDIRRDETLNRHPYPDTLNRAPYPIPPDLNDQKIPGVRTPEPVEPGLPGLCVSG